MRVDIPTPANDAAEPVTSDKKGEVMTTETIAKFLTGRKAVRAGWRACGGRQ